MSRPENPNTIILKNQFYPKGLTEGQVYDYYMKWKGPILNETRGRELMFAIMTDVNKPIIRRRGKDNKFLRLNNSNYEEVITGRSIAIYSTMHSYEEFAIVDIDSDNLNQAKQASLDVLNTITSIDLVREAKIRFTGKTSFHIICTLVRKSQIDRIRGIFETFLKNSDLAAKYTIAYKRTRGIPNLDLSPNKFRGAYITLGSLSLLGLRCVDLLPHRLRSFQPYQMTI